MKASNDEIRLLAELLKDHSGIDIGGLKKDFVQTRLARRLSQLRMNSLDTYLKTLEQDRGGELERFINLMTTNHTFFFREKPHLEYLSQTFFAELFASGARSLGIWSAACSTGEEVYTMGVLALDFIRSHGINAEVRVHGTDINTDALKVAKNGVYPERRMAEVPEELRNRYFKRGRHPRRGFYKVGDELRSIVRFAPLNLVRPVQMFSRYNVVLCRNVLIYFDRETIRSVIRFLRDLVSDNGVLITGLSEQVDHLDTRLNSLGRSIHTILPPLEAGRSTSQASTGPNSRPRIELKSSPAWDRPQRPDKTAERTHTKTEANKTQAKRQGRASTHSRSRRSTESGGRPKDNRLISPFSGGAGIEKIIAIGSSTGGPEALAKVLRDIPDTAPPIVLAQHIDGAYTGRLADNLAHSSSLEIVVAERGTVLQPGHVYLAPGKKHLRVIRSGKALMCAPTVGSAGDLFTPSVDKLLMSLTTIDGIGIVVAILTGMGNDGQAGATALRRKGALVIAQDRDSCSVWGMPKAVVKAGAATSQAPLNQMASEIMRAVARTRVPKLGNKAA